MPKPSTQLKILKMNNIKELKLKKSAGFQSSTFACFTPGEDDALHLKFMRLPKGQPKRCLCGYWFKLVDVEYKDYGQ